MRTKDFKAGACTIRLLPVIKGLVSETDMVKKAFDTFHPDKVAISISKEELEGLRNMPNDFEPDLSRYEEIYVKGLSKFGDVAAPPPCYVATLELADHLEIPLVPVDLDEDSYSELYCAAVPGSTLFRHSTRTWVLKRRNFGAENPEEFVKSWDRAVNHLEGFGTIEKKRAEVMASGILAACDGAKQLLAIIELERSADVASILSDKARRS
jgi:hypothetical protein